MTAGSTRQAMATILASVLMAALFVFANGAKADTTLMYQDGVDGYTGTQDTDIFGHVGGSANVNDGSSGTLAIYDREQDTVNIYRDLIRFDLSSISPSAVIGSATLTLTNASGHGTSSIFQERGIVNSLYVINSADAAWTESTATWNNANNTGPQAWAGGPGLASPADYGATPTATAATPNGPSDSDNETMTFTLDAAGIAAINDWIQNPSDNTGFLMRQPTSSASIDSFYSSDYVNLSLGDHGVSFRPELTLITTPEPASLALLAVGGMTLLRRRRA